jgi:hypothetical protein
VEQVQEALQPYGLWLGMTEEQIDQVKLGLVPTTPIEEITHRMSSMRYDHGFSDETLLSG